MSSQVQTTLRALSVVYPAMILILAYEMSTKLYKTPFITAVAKSYGHETAPLVTGTVAAATYLLQLITAPIWGRIADAGYPRLTLGAAILAPLVPSVAILFGPSTSDSRPVIVLFNVSTVLSGIFGSPLAVAFNLSKTLLKLKKVTSPVITARAMLLVMSCVPLGVLSGIGITELLKQLLGHQDTFQKTIFSLSLTSIAIVSFMALLMYVCGPMARSFLVGADNEQNLFKQVLIEENYDENGQNEENNLSATDPRRKSRHSFSIDTSNMERRTRGDSLLNVLSQDVAAPSFHNMENDPSNQSDACCSKIFFVLRWLKNPQFFRLALAFAFVEFGHEGYFAEHGTSFKLSFPKSDLLPAILMMGAGLNAFNILFLEPLITKCGVTTPTKAIMATVSMTLCYGLWSFGNLPLTFIGELVGLMALMFKPSVTFMLTARLAGEGEIGEAIGAMHGFGMLGAMLGIVAASFSVSAFGSFGLLVCAIGPLAAMICLAVDRNINNLLKQ